MRRRILGAALAVVMILACAITAFAVNKTDAISGDLTVTTFFNEKTDAIELKSGDSYTIKFNNKTNGEGTNNYENFILAITGAIGEAYTGKEQEVLIIRADNYGWGGDMSDFVAPDPDKEGNKLAFETNIVWEKWGEMMKAGVDVTINLSRDGNTLTYDATIGEYYVKTTATSGVALPETLYVFLSGEKCTLTGISTVKNNTEPEPSESTPEESTPEESTPEESTPEESKPAESKPAESKPAGEKIEGQLTVTNFFNEKTNAVSLKSGESYTFKFNNKSNGTNNWENFILAITGATGTAYTGADQEVLIIRADNWGWGGGMSDFVAPDATEGNKLAFESNIDWDKWGELTKAGVDVTLTIARSGNTLTYNATIGDYYVKLNATSGKALPETLYVFLTGENCVLSNIQTVSGPATGDNTALYAMMVVAAVSAIAVIALVSKKKIAA